MGVGVGECEGGLSDPAGGILDPLLEGNGGTLAGSACFSGLDCPLCCRKLPVGVCAVFMLEYGLNLLFFSLSLSGVASLDATFSRLPLLPTSPYA